MNNHVINRLWPSYLRHVVQAVEDVLASLLGLDPCFALVVLGSLQDDKKQVMLVKAAVDGTVRAWWDQCNCNWSGNWRELPGIMQVEVSASVQVCVF